MSILVTGDTHGTIDMDSTRRFFEENEGKYTKKDYLIICGDVCACGFSLSLEKLTQEALSALPVTVLWVDGNHENFMRLYDLPVEEWHGGKVHFVREDIIHLMRGQIFEIEGRTFFTFGGAYSIDKYRRTKYVSWFPEELPSDEEYEEGWKNLEKAGFKVDYILTHDGPYDVVATMGYDDADEPGEAKLRRFLQDVADRTEFTGWYFGHYHEDSEVAVPFRCLYQDVLELL